MSVIKKHIQELMKPQEVMITHRKLTNADKEMTVGNQERPELQSIVFRVSKGLPEDLNLTPMNVQKLSGINEDSPNNSRPGNSGNLVEFGGTGGASFMCPSRT